MKGMDLFLDFCYSPLAAINITYLEFFIYVLAGIVGLLAVGTAYHIYAKNRPTEGERHYNYVQCATCGWTGSVSKYIRVCPKCNDSNFVSRY